MKLTYFQYARKSSQGESKQIESIPDQLKVLRQLRETSQLFVAAEFSEARSAMKPDARPVFREMLDRINAGEANAILVWHLNRLFRNSKEYGEVAYMLETGVIQCIKTPEREYHPEDHGLLMAVEASVSTQYSKDLKRDVNRGVREKAEKGWYPYKAKAGYRVNQFTKEIEPDPVRFAQLRSVIDLMLSTTLSVEDACRELNALGFRTPKNSTGADRPMSRTGMYRFLTDRFYQGEFCFEGVWQQGRHTPLVTRQEFAAIQKHLQRPLQARPHTHRLAYAGMMRCGICGCQITAEKHVKRRASGPPREYTYYHCTGRRGCVQRSITEGDLEEKLRSEIERAKLDPFFIDWALSELDQDAVNQHRQVMQIEPAQATQLRSLSMKIDSLWEMRHEGEITGEEFRERKARYEEEMREIRARDQFAATKVERDREKIKKALVFSRDAYQKFTAGGVIERQQVAQEFGEEYVLTQEKLDIKVNPIINKFMTFELKSLPPQQVGNGGSGLQIEIWRAMLTEIRNLLTD